MKSEQLIMNNGKCLNYDSFDWCDDPDYRNQSNHTNHIHHSSDNGGIGE